MDWPMIDLDSMEVVSTQDLWRPTHTYQARVSVVAKITVDDRCGVGSTLLVNELRKRIWHEAYGDLRRPLSELEVLVYRQLPPPFAEEARRYFNQLHELLTPKNNPQNPLKTGSNGSKG